VTGKTAGGIEQKLKVETESCGRFVFFPHDSKVSSIAKPRRRQLYSYYLLRFIIIIIYFYRIIPCCVLLKVLSANGLRDYES
jgi:hypothetical protein